MEHGQTPSHLSRILRALAVPAAGLCLVALLDNRIRSGALTLQHGGKVVAVGYLLLGIALAYRLVCEVLLDLVLSRASGRQIPKILKHLIGIATVVLAVLLTINLLYPSALASLLTLSSIIAVVIGLALRPIILDIFSGVSANLDAAFRIGDWIEITRRGGTASQTGWVEEINWRTTHLRTRSGNLVVCPNSTLSTAIITNFSRPSRLSRYELRVKLPPELDPDRARRVLLAAARATLDHDGGPSSGHAPDVLITAMEASGVQYAVRFWLDPASHSADRAVHAVARSVLHHLQLAGIPLSEKVVLHRDSRGILDPARPAARAEVLARAALFSGVEPDALGQLAAAVRLAPFEQGDILIRQGDLDHDLFLLFEGGVEVLVEVDGREVSIARMQAGDYFGEMSLLTGEARSATIRATTGGAAYRLGREAIAPLLESDPALMDLLSRNLAERNLGRRAKTAEAEGECPQQKQDGLAKALLGKMRAIFRPGR